MFLRRWLSRRQFLFLFIMLPILPFGSRSLICRSDPIVTLSNGIVLTIGANIDSKMQDVQEVHYELHVPEGVSLISEVATPFWKKTQETFTFVADQVEGQYVVITTVHTKKGDNTIIADTSAVSLDGADLGYFSGQGGQDEAIIVSFSL